MFTQEYPVRFSYAIDENDTLLIHLTASVHWQPYSGTYIINEFTGAKAAGFGITLPEIRICKRESVWVHTDSEAETRLSLAVGKAIDEHQESEGSFLAVLDDFLAKTIAFHGADCGNIQLFDLRSNVIQIMAHSGFNKTFLDYFKYVSADDGTVCGNAMRFRSVNFVPDLLEDPAYIPHRDVIRNAGIRSVLSYPLILEDGAFAGVISTHWKRVLGEQEIPVPSADLGGLIHFLQQYRVK
ncbi:MAG: GAF domain-containing protein [Pseudobacter sp.]|uniref:GAF domain-containing protein n=1 Tax=Pseudobacter sp. TaxID=2045420 RepID=UPI003F7CFD12